MAATNAPGNPGQNKPPQNPPPKSGQNAPQQTKTRSIKTPPSANIGPFIFFGTIFFGIIVLSIAALLTASLVFVGLVALLELGIGLLCYHNVPKLNVEAIDILSIPVGFPKKNLFVHLGAGPTFVIPRIIGTTRFSEEEQTLDIHYAPAGGEDLPDDKGFEKTVFKSQSLASYSKDGKNIVLIREVQIRYQVLNPYLTLTIGRRLVRGLYATTVSSLAHQIRRRTRDDCLDAKAKSLIQKVLENALDKESAHWGVDITEVKIADPGQLPETEAARQLSAEAKDLQQELGISSDSAMRATLAARGKAEIKETVFNVGGAVADLVAKIVGANQNPPQKP